MFKIRRQEEAAYGREVTARSRGRVVGRGAGQRAGEEAGDTLMPPTLPG